MKNAPQGVSGDKMLVLLLENGSDCRDSVRDLLTEDGFRTWQANDVSHAFEEISDFTVRSRPDAILLDVHSIHDSFDTLNEAFHTMSDEKEIAVLGLRDNTGRESESPMIAGNLNDLKCIINREVRRSAAAF